MTFSAVGHSADFHGMLARYAGIVGTGIQYAEHECGKYERYYSFHLVSPLRRCIKQVAQFQYATQLIVKIRCA